MTLHPTDAILAIEGGGTRTRAWLVSGYPRALDVLARHETGPSNLHGVGPSGVGAVVGEILDRTGVSRDRVAVLSLGLAGVSTPADEARIVEAIRDQGWVGPVSIASDARATAVGAVGETGGILLIAGTGSIAWGVAPDGREARCGGWGPGVGDEGSGHAIGRAALARVTMALDGRAGTSPLVEAIREHLGLPDLDALSRWIRHDTRAPVAVAGVVPAVFDLAGRCEEARRIVDDAAGQLVKLVRSVKSRLSFPPAVRLALHGGVLRGPLEDALRARLRRAFPRIETISVDPEAALRGLVLLGRRHLASRPADSVSGFKGGPA